LEKAITKWQNIIEKSKKICDKNKIKYDDYFPSTLSKNLDEKQIANSVSNYRRAHNGKPQHTVYDEVDDMINVIFPKWLNFK
jgi:hypothetical protein